MQLFGGGNRGRVVQTAGEQVDRIPDAVKEDDSVEHGQDRHGHAAGQSTLHAGGDGIDLQRQPGALHLLPPPASA